LLRKHKGALCHVTEKLDGQSATYHWDRKRTVVASRNCWKHKPDNSNHWHIQRNLNVIGRLKRYCKNHGYKSATIQGEICGPGIQGNKLGLPALMFYAFNLFIDGKQQHGTIALSNACAEMELDRVPHLLGSYKLDDNAESILEIARLRFSENRGNPPEGVVIRALDGSFSFKAINPDFVEEYLL
jgi:hypothetical protein